MLISSTALFSQKINTNFNSDVKQLNDLGKKIIGGETNEIKYQANKEHITILKNLINKNGSFDKNFNALKTISILQKNKLKIYNWVIPLTDGTFEYFAFLQYKKSKTDFLVIELIDKSDQIKSPENKVLTSKSWYGALYHHIIYNKDLGENYYTLLGWDGNNNLTNKKIIDVINISDNGMVRIGAPIFKMEKKTQKRIIFEYSEDAMMSLKYHNELEKIVFDFLVPTSSKLVGVYEYYGPSLNRFDALWVEKSKWVYENDIKIELDRNIKDGIWKDPKM